MRKNTFKILSIALMFCFIGTLAYCGSNQGQLGSSWMVQDDGDIVPDASKAQDVGSASYPVDNVYADDVVVTTDVTFRENLLAVGRINGYSTVASSSTALQPSSLPYSVVIKQAGGNNSLDETDGGTRLANGTPGKVMQFELLGVMTDGSWIITPVTVTGFTAVTLDTAGEYVTLLYVDDTIGWIRIGDSGATFTLPTGLSLGFDA